jgi:hypothetical protein
MKPIMIYRGKRSFLSDVDYNIESGKEYLEGTTKFKPVKVELNVSNAKL